jgi:hypothetical protein
MAISQLQQEGLLGSQPHHAGYTRLSDFLAMRYSVCFP